MGQPWARQNASSPASSAFRSMLAAAAMHAGARLCRAQKSVKAASNCSAHVPLRQPMPSTPMWGTRCKASPAGERARAKSASAGVRAGSTPAGGVPCTGNSAANRTDCPASSLLLTCLMRSASSTVQFWCFAHSSTAKMPWASVAVVITGTAPHTAASARARSLAPPRWPDSTGTAKRPHSSSTTTAGSDALLRQWGAMARTAMPTAPTKTRASLCVNCRAVHPARETPPLPQRSTLPGRASASRWASARPVSVKAR